ncbi:MAG: hypothetical protein CFH08_02287 [Alphaproteobacteria bacterium MarineAlpha3_Bin7]|nr:MAG: hypothetical protein CFH08_02287 [Alphaproteobacteria bacterium MarineAlpha3_Bin7]
MIVLKLAWQSVLNRKFTTILTILSIAVSVVLILGVEKVRSGARVSFANTISGTDLIVGSRSGDVQLLLYSIFHIGDATSNITWKTVEDIKRRNEVDWLVPIALGDSHRGYRVVGTSQDYFTRFRYRRNIKLDFTDGEPFEDLFEAVIGSEIAKVLKYKVGDEIILAHGTGPVKLNKEHGNTPFRISGILSKSGTPSDRAVLVSMEAIEAIHVGWETGNFQKDSVQQSPENLRKMKLHPKAATALYVGLKSRMQTFSLQRWINSYPEEAITGVLPGVAFGQLWALIGNVETVLLIISSMVVFVAILGMLISIMASLNERRREMAILRAIGASPIEIFTLLAFEALTLSILGIIVGFVSVFGAMLLLQPFLENITGLFIEIATPSSREIVILGIILMASIVAGIIPAIRAYLTSLSDGLMIKF